MTEEEEPAAYTFEADCLEFRGRVLTGKYAHWCMHWDLLPIDETCPEWPCACAADLGFKS